MKITRQDSSALVVVDFPWLLGFFIFPFAAALLYIAVSTAVRGQGIGGTVAYGAGALVVAFAGSFFVKRCAFEFDLVRRECTWRRRGIFGERSGTLPFDCIRHCVVQSTTSNNTTTYRITLQTEDGDIPLTQAYTTGEQRPRSVCETINRTLNLQPQAAIEDEILDLARKGQKIEAIRLARERYGYDLTRAKDFVEGLLQ
jgi:hypothetical protein